MEAGLAACVRGEWWGTVAMAGASEGAGSGSGWGGGDNGSWRIRQWEVRGARTDGADLIGMDGRSRFTRGGTKGGRLPLTTLI